MAQYVFTYNAVYVDYSSQEVRAEVIKVLDDNGASAIKQCLDTTFIFDSDQNSTYWWNVIRQELDTPGGVLEDGFYLLTRVYFSANHGHAIKRKCKPDLQGFVDYVLKNK